MSCGQMSINVCVGRYLTLLRQISAEPPKKDVDVVVEAVGLDVVTRLISYSCPMSDIYDVACVP